MRQRAMVVCEESWNRRDILSDKKHSSNCIGYTINSYPEPEYHRFNWQLFFPTGLRAPG